MTNKIITIYGECDEEDDPQAVVKMILDGFDQLNKMGYRDLAFSTLDEAAIALRLTGYLQGRKSAYRAKKDGDWEKLIAGIDGCETYSELVIWEFEKRSLVATLPADWIPELREIFSRKKKELRGNCDG